MLSRLPKKTPMLRGDPNQRIVDLLVFLATDVFFDVERTQLKTSDKDSNHAAVQVDRSNSGESICSVYATMWPSRIRRRALPNQARSKDQCKSCVPDIETPLNIRCRLYMQKRWMVASARRIAYNALQFLP